nr:hypothetical protein [Tanacetum cinerariifolium]
QSKEVMDSCTSLTRRVVHLELDKIAQDLEITKLKRRVKKLERRTKGRMIADMDADVDVVLEEAKDVTADAKDGQDANEEESEPAELQEVGDIVTTAKIIIKVVTAVSTTITATNVLVLTATTAVAPSFTAAPSRRRKGVVIRDPEESTTTTSKIIHSQAKSKDKGKGILPDIHAQIWKNQRSVHGQGKVISWKLLESCGVQIITFTTTQLILLVERKYPLAKFTLNQMLNNVRLEVEEESEVSSEFLRFIRQQHQEGAQLE